MALLVVLVGAFLSGWAAFAAGTEVPSRLTTVGHGLLGLGVVVLAPWKTVVARRAPVLRVASLVLAAVIVICLVAGFVEVFAGYGLAAGLSPIQVHVGAAFVAVPCWSGTWCGIGGARCSAEPTSAGASCCAPPGSSPASARRTRRWRESAGSRAWPRPADRHRVAPDRAARIPATIWLLDRVPCSRGRPPGTGGRLAIPVSDLDARARAGGGPAGLHQRLVRRRRVVGRALIVAVAGGPAGRGEQHRW